MAHPLDNWHQSAIACEVETEYQRLRLQPIRLDCPWCAKRHLLIQDRDSRARGHMLCKNCGEFFRWIAWGDDAATRRVRAKPKERPTVRGFDQQYQPNKAYHLVKIQPDGRPGTACGAEIVATPSIPVDVKTDDLARRHPESLKKLKKLMETSTGLTDVPGDVTCEACKAAS